MPQRLEALTRWLTEVLTADTGSAQQVVDFQLTPASTDASFRRYFRVTLDVNSRRHLSNKLTQSATLIIMDAPPDKEQTEPFVRIATLLVGIGLNAPRILAQNVAQGFLLLSDLDNQEYLSVLDEHTVEGLYADALDALFVMQRDAPHDTVTPSTFIPTSLPTYDNTLLMREMGLFRDWYCEQHCNITFSPTQSVELDAVFQQLSDAAQQQPQVFVHRDYHSRNLMRTAQNNPGILDFQDAVVGPVTYDLVSLLRDCYIKWPREQVERWALTYLQRAAAAGIIPGESDETYLHWFDWMGVQRHLKAAGIFARLNIRDGKPGYLADIPRTLNYVCEVSARYPELQVLHRILSEGIE